MAQAEVIREFLVQLGFKTDEKSLKNFSSDIENATKSVVKLVAAIEGAALTVGAGVAHFASNLEALYFASVKAGSSATNLKAFSKAAENFGASSDQALSSVQALARFMRNSPGSEGFIKSLGVNTRDANGQLRETVDIMADLGQQLKGKPYYIAKQYGDMLGIDEDTLRAMINGDFGHELDSQRDRLKNSGFDKASKDAHQFMMGLRELQTYVEAFGMKVQEALMNKLGMSMDQLSDWFVINGPRIADRVADIAVQFMNLAEKALPAITWIVDKMIWADEKTGGWSTKLIALLVVMKEIGGFAVINGIIGLASAFTKLGTAVAGAEAAAGGGFLSKLLGFATSAVGRSLLGVGLMLHSENLNEGEDDEVKKIHAQQDRMTGGNDAVSYFMSQGWSKEQAAGLAANIKNESSFDPGAENQGHYGLAQWDSRRQRAFAQWAGHDIHGSSAAEQMAFMNYELTQGSERNAGNLLRATTNAQAASNVVFSQYERAGDATGPRRAADAVQIAQTTNIHVNGGDPAATGKAVAGEQSQVNQNLVRNLQANVS